jgi:hypothetical protein
MFLQEFKRGKEKAEISYICFDQQCKLMAATSDRGTIHIWSMGSCIKKSKETPVVEIAKKGVINGELKEIKSNVGISVLCPGPVDTEFANVSSLGARKVVKDGKSPEKVVAHCLKCVSQKRYISIMAFKWKFKAFMSRFISKIWFARYTFKHEKRPSN